jgi:outer membrane protein X
MKKLFLTLCIALFSVGAFAQEKGEMAVGGSLNFNTKASMFGIGARYQYFIIDNLRGDGEFTYYFKKDGVSMFTILASANYLFNITDQFAVYPLAGLGVGISKVNVEPQEVHIPGVGTIKSDGVSGTNSDFIGQFGAGAQYFFTDKFGVNCEAKYQFGSGGTFVLAAGVLYKF